MSKYEIKTVHHSDGSNDTFVIYSKEESAFFAGYDFMGSVNWAKFPSSQCELTADDDPQQIVRDLESADEHAEAMCFNLIRIIWYDKEQHTTEGFKSISFRCINQTFPSASPVTVTYTCVTTEDEYLDITVPLVHSIESV